MDVEALTGVRGARAAVSSPACSLWPYRFVAGLLERAMGRNGGLNVQTGTPVVAVEKGEGEGEKGWWLVRTEGRGTVRARKVVFATNAYTAGLLHEYRGVITPFKGTCAHLATLDGREPAQPRLSHTYNIEYGRQKLETVDYLNPRPDGGIVVGGGKWLYEEQRELWYNTVDDSTLIEPVIKAKYFEGYMRRNFTGWDDSGSELERIWTGSEFRPSQRLYVSEHVGVFRFTDMVVQSWASLLMDFHMLERFLGSRTNGFLQGSMAAAMHWYIFVPRVLQRWY